MTALRRRPGLAHTVQIIGPARRHRPVGATRTGSPSTAGHSRPARSTACGSILHQRATDRYVGPGALDSTFAGHRTSGDPRGRSARQRACRRRGNPGSRTFSNTCSRRGRAGTGRRCCGNPWSADRRSRLSAGSECRWSGLQIRRTGS
jgi:hypothetical protein